MATNASTAVNIGAQTDETELFRANEDLRPAGAAAAVSKTLCANVANSPIVRALLLLVVIALLLFLIERLSAGKGDVEGNDALKEVLRSVLKRGMQQAAALPVLEERNATAEQ
jgi:hypothetical protein